jgi:hypothetical protein
LIDLKTAPYFPGSFSFVRTLEILDLLIYLYERVRLKFPRYRQ